MARPEAEAALRALEGLRLLHEQLEDARQHRGVDADAVVATRSTTWSPFGARRESLIRPPGSVYFAALVSRLATTCASRAGSASTIRPRRHVELEVVAALLEQRAGHLDRLARPRSASSSRSRAQLDLAARDARHVEQVVDQADQVVDLALDDGALVLERLVAAQPHQLQRGQDRRQRVAQLVAEHRQELVLGAVGRLGLARAPLASVGDVDRRHGNAVDLPRRVAQRLVDEVEEALLGRPSR